MRGVSPIRPSLGLRQQPEDLERLAPGQLGPDLQAGEAALLIHDQGLLFLPIQENFLRLGLPARALPSGCAMHLGESS